MNRPMLQKILPTLAKVSCIGAPTALVRRIACKTQSLKVDDRVGMDWPALKETLHNLQVEHGTYVHT